MKIHFIADLERRKFEGRTSTVLSLKKLLEQKGCQFVDNSKEADLIHFHSSGIRDAFKAAKLKQKLKKPVVYTLYSVSKTEPLSHFRNHFAQNYYFHPRKTNFLLSYASIIPLRWRTWPFKKIDAVVVPSKFVQKRLFSNCKLIRIGVDVNYFGPLDKEKQINPEKEERRKLKIAYFGHPSVYKGLLDYARASKKLSQHEWSVYITKLTRKIEKTLLKINPHLKIIGLIEDIHTAYQETDLVILPYRSNLGAISNPLVLLEAMSSGKAIITTNFLFLKEIAQNAALIVKPYSPKQIVQAVRKLEKKELREELGKRARKIIVQEFTQERMVREHLELYQKLMNK